MDRKKIVLTGATSGIGQEIARKLFKANHMLWLIVRNPDKVTNLKTDLLMINPRGQLEVVMGDLSSMRETQKAAQHISNQTDCIDIVINNAGGIYEEKLVTDEGLETTMASNYLGHYVLTKHLIPLLEKSDDARIINVTSEMYRMSDWSEDLMFENKPYDMSKAYANTKLAQIFYTQWLAENLKSKNIKANCVHPGVVDSGFADNNKGWIKYGMNLIRPFILSSEKAARPIVDLALHEKYAATTGEYFNKRKSSSVAKYATDTNSINDLITQSEKWLQTLNKSS